MERGTCCTRPWRPWRPLCPLVLGRRPPTEGARSSSFQAEVRSRAPSEQAPMCQGLQGSAGEWPRDSELEPLSWAGLPDRNA